MKQLNRDMKKQDVPPKNITPAATVILTRTHADELQIYLLKRSHKSGFMAGNFVFPGGTVDSEDRRFNVWKTHVDMDLNDISSKLGGDIPDAEALAYGIAAIRETLEEAGVFFAHKEKEINGDLERVCNLRLDEKLEKDWFIHLVENECWCLTLSALSRWSHWITPESMKRRFDTRFFLASMPSEQNCRPDSRETTLGLWISPEQGLAGNLDGKIPLSPPTLITLHELLRYSNMNDLTTEANQRQWGDSLLPRLVPLDKGAVIVEPWDPMYRQKEIKINYDKLPKSLLAVGEPFSKIWYDEGIWKPVRI